MSSGIGAGDRGPGEVLHAGGLHCAECQVEVGVQPTDWLPMLPGPPGHSEMREKHQRTIQRRPTGAHPAPSSLCHHPIRLGGSALSWWQEDREQHVNTSRVPPPQYSEPFPKLSLAGFLRHMLRVGPSNCRDNPCPSRIFSGAVCTQGLSPQPSMFSSKLRLSAWPRRPGPRSGARGMANDPAPGQGALAPPPATFSLPREWPAVDSSRRRPFLQGSDPLESEFHKAFLSSVPKI